MVSFVSKTYVGLQVNDCSIVVQSKIPGKDKNKLSFTNV